MLLIDPLLAWQSTEDAFNGTRDLGYESSNLFSYFPRMSRRDDEAAAPRAVGGAIAGILCKLDRRHGTWHDLDRVGLGLSRDLLPTVEIDALDAQRLARAGLNVIARGPAGSARICGSVTMGQSGAAQRQYASLCVRRTCLRIAHAIDVATRWAVFAADDGCLADRIRAQVSAYLAGLSKMGAFENEQLVVECDAGLRKRSSGPDHGFAIFVRCQPLGSAEPIAFTIHQSIAGGRLSSSAFAPG
jgi:phage tail sheath protein FI